jgi:uncharacterized protein YfiM (DUF2279 family)
MLRAWALVAVLLLVAPAHALTLEEAHSGSLSSVSEGFGQHEFHWANDSWIGQDKLFDHGSFAYVLAQTTEDIFRPDNATERALSFTLNMVPWFIKEVVDGYANEGASYKDFIWSGAGALLALIVH